MIVDDSRVIRKVSRTIVESVGYEVTEAENGEEALAKCKVAMPALILLDLMMPVMDGAEFHGHLRRDPRLADIPVVLLTADAHARERAEAMGIETYLKKPVDIEDLIAVITDHARPAGL